jgi:hypothetical protein
MTSAPPSQTPTTQEKIKELEQRLEIGVSKLWDLEQAGLWDEQMYAYWLRLEETYIKLCKAAKLFKDE